MSSSIKEDNLPSRTLKKQITYSAGMNQPSNEETNSKQLLHERHNSTENKPLCHHTSYASMISQTDKTNDTNKNFALHRTEEMENLTEQQDNNSNETLSQSNRSNLKRTNEVEHLEDI
jgi:hypothetical protein